MKKIIVMIAAVAVVLSLAACGSESAAPATEAPAAAPETEEVAAPAEETAVEEPAADGAETYSAKAKGFGGKVKVTCTVEDGVITGVTLDCPDESANKGGSEATKTALIEQVLEAQSGEIDGVTGCTLTSDAVKEAMNDILAQMNG